jgi:hypothetical protein
MAGALVVVGKSIDAVLVTGGVLGADFFSSGVDGAIPFSIDRAEGATLDAASVCVGTAAGTTADEVAGALVRFGKSDGAISYTGGVVGADSSSHLVSFVFSGGVVPAGDATDTVTGASRFGMSDDTVFDTGGVINADFSSLSISFAASGSTVSAAAAAGRFSNRCSGKN